MLFQHPLVAQGLLLPPENDKNMVPLEDPSGEHQAGNQSHVLETAKRLGYEDLDLDAPPSGEKLGQIPNLIITGRVADAVLPMTGVLQKVFFH